MKRIFNLFVLIALLALTFSAPGMTPASADQQLPPLYSGCGGVASPPRTNTTFEQAVFDLTNEERAAKNIPPLKRWDGLDQSAQYHAIDQAEDNYYSHETQDRVNGALQIVCGMSDRVRPFYFPAGPVGENIAAGQTTPADAVLAWMNSTHGHREQILNPNHWVMGVGYHYKSGTDYGHYWVQNFGRPVDQNGMAIPLLIINRDKVSTTSATVDIYIYGCGCDDEWQEMRLRNDGGEWGSWQPFNNKLTWTLNNTNGIRTVEAELKWYDDTVIISDSVNYTRPTYIAAFRSVGAQDGWILESSETSAAGGTMNSTAAALRLGDDAARKQYRSILSFDTSSLPDTAVINKVTLKIKRQGIVGGGDPVTAFAGFLVDIRKGAFGTSALQLTDWQAAAGKTVGSFTPSLIGGWYTLNLTGAKAYVNKLTTGDGLTQIRLYFALDDNDNALVNYLSLYSGEAALASRPQLVIEYYAP